MIAVEEKLELGYSSQLYEKAYADFQRAWPTYRSTAQLDALRATEYARLDRLGHVYLDYTGGGLYAEAQLRQHHELLADNVFGNPHSNNPTSLAMTHLVERARGFCFGILQRYARRICRHFHAERQWRAQTRWRVLSVYARRPICADL